MKEIQKLEILLDHYEAILCDVWGVIHNGAQPFMKAVSALRFAKKRGKIVILVTNSPRSSAQVIHQLQSIGVPKNTWDAIVTSGDVTRTLIKNSPKQVFYIGADYDLALLSGLPSIRVSLNEAECVVCTGFYEKEYESLDTYMLLLEKIYSKRLPFICANPDLMIEKDGEIFLCAGFLAEKYRSLGGIVQVAGKPYSPIYDLALETLEALSKKKILPNRILAIGDGLLTDIKGAQAFGIHDLYVKKGVHMHEYYENGRLNNGRLQDCFLKHNCYPSIVIENLI